MATTITLTAEAEFSYGGKQYVARIMGRDPKFTFAREFVGRKEGKRKEYATYTTDEPGLYMTCDVDRRGDKDDSFCVVYPAPDGLRQLWVDRDDAMAIARRLDERRVDFRREALRIMVDAHNAWLAAEEGKDPEAKVYTDRSYGALPKGEHRRKAVVEARRGLRDRYEAELNPPAPAAEPAPRDAFAIDVVATPPTFPNATAERPEVAAARAAIAALTPGERAALLAEYA